MALTKITVFVDVDGTLINVFGQVNQELIDWLKDKREKDTAGTYEFFLWSMQGADYARRVASELGIESLFVAIVSKPQYVIDDSGWSWIHFTEILNPFDISSAKLP